MDAPPAPHHDGSPPSIPARIDDRGPLSAALADHGVVPGDDDAALVFDASDLDPRGWDELEADLLRAYRLSRQAMTARAPVVYVLDGPSVYGHGSPLRSALATGLLGGVRSLAAEGRCHGIAAHAVTVDATVDAPARAAAVAALLRDRPATGQLVHCDAVHVGRPAA